MSKLQRLRRTSLDELRVRGSQALASFAERRGWAGRAKFASDNQFLKLLNPNEFENGLQSASQLHDQLTRKDWHPFFSFLDNPEAIVNILRSRWPGSETELIDQAERITKGHFDLLAFHDLHFGDPVDWHFEPVAKKRSPLIHWSKINYLDGHLTGDKKIIWELNRHQYFVRLGQAYLLTGDERYAATFVAHINQWIDQNPPKIGINWASSLEVAFRSISWLWALQFFKNSNSLDAETVLRAYKILHINARHLETYLSTYFSPNTHLTGEALGLFYLGTLLPEFLDSARWRNTGLQILITQLPRHVKTDGVYFEQSSYYHRYTTDFYLHLWILLNSTGDPAQQKLEEKLQLLLDHLMYITRPDGSTPLFGDDDGGKLLDFQARSANDFRPTLAAGAALFKRGDYKFVAGGACVETLWLLGPEVLSILDQVEAHEPDKESIAFTTGGYYIMRDGWTPKSNYLLFDCGPHGSDNCGHAHADALSFELAVNGCTFLVDPGTYTYTGSIQMRDWFRGTAAHNTLTLDGESSSVGAGPFSWKTIARSECHSWITHRNFDYLAAAHDGFTRLPQPAMHTRAILFLKNRYWVLHDNVRSLGAHKLEAWFHFDSTVGPLAITENTVRAISANDCSAGLQLSTFADGEWVTEERWVSHCYGGREAAPVFAFSMVAKGSDDLVTFLVPEVPGASLKSPVKRIKAVNGHAFEINIGERHDSLLLYQASNLRSGVETPRLRSDFDVTWASFDRRDPSVPRELVLINGHTLELEGQALVRSTEKIEYLVANRTDDVFRVETNKGILEKGLPVEYL